MSLFLRVSAVSFCILLIGCVTPNELAMKVGGPPEVDGKTILPHARGAELGKGQKDVALTDKDEPFKHSFEESGTHVIEVIADQDKLRADNSYLASIKVWDNVPVLIVDGEASAESLQGRIDFKGESDFLRIALQPFREVQFPGMTDLFNVRVIRAVDFDAESLGDARVVIMANVARFTEGAGGQLETLENYIRQGGGVLWFCLLYTSDAADE